MTEHRQPDPQDPWRTRMLGAAVVPLLVVAALVLNDLRLELTEWAADAEARAIGNAFWRLVTPVCVTLSHVVLALGVLAAFVTRRRGRRSRRIVLFAFATSLPLLVLPRLAPLSWQFAVSPELAEQAAATIAAAGPLMAVGCVLDLLPLLLSITVGLSRAGLHRHAVAPDQPAGATTAFVATLQLGLLIALAVGVTVHTGATTWLVVGLLLLLLHYTTAATVCFLLARPTPRRSPRWRAVLLASAVLLLLPGVVDLAIGLAHVQILDKPLLGWGEREGHLGPGKLAIEVLLFAGRSLVTAIAANDLLARSHDATHT